MEINYKLDKIRDLSDNDQEFIETLAMTFLEEVPADARLLKIAVESADHLATYKAAHKMKPTIDMFELGVLDELIEVQDWGKFEKKEIDILPKLAIVLAAVEQASNEMRSDFNL